jgi:Zn-finger nucleic acid-binding protein
VCPRDGTVLVGQQVRGMELARCPACLGLWLPAASVKSLTGRLGFGGAGRATTIRCPDDGAGLTLVQRSQVEADRCDHCGGVWLDRGELERLLVRPGLGGVKRLGEGSGDRATDWLTAVGDGAGQVAGEAVGWVIEAIADALSGW